MEGKYGGNTTGFQGANVDSTKEMHIKNSFISN